MTAVALLEQITRSNKPLVVDADALNVLGEHPGWINQVPPNSILTPHPLELSRIIHRRVTSSSAVSAALSLAIERNIYIVLKGHHTAVCTPEGHAYFNSCSVFTFTDWLEIWRQKLCRKRASLRRTSSLICRLRSRNCDRDSPRLADIEDGKPNQIGSNHYRFSKTKHI